MCSSRSFLERFCVSVFAFVRFQAGRDSSKFVGNPASFIWVHRLQPYAMHRSAYSSRNSLTGFGRFEWRRACRWAAKSLEIGGVLLSSLVRSVCNEFEHIASRSFPMPSWVSSFARCGHLLRAEDIAPIGIVGAPHRKNLFCLFNSDAAIV